MKFTGFCAWCSEPSEGLSGRIFLCKKHIRFIRMRNTSQKRGKYVPSYSELDQLHKSIGMKCPSCEIQMNWMANENRKSAVTLQHNRDGTITFLCLSCNCKHAVHEGDSFYAAPKDKKKCFKCGKFKNYSDFCKDRHKSSGLKPWCRKCSTIAHLYWAHNVGKAA